MGWGEEIVCCIVDTNVGLVQFLQSFVSVMEKFEIKILFTLFSGYVSQQFLPRTCFGRIHATEYTKSRNAGQEVK